MNLKALALVCLLVGQLLGRIQFLSLTSRRLTQQETPTSGSPDASEGQDDEPRSYEDYHDTAAKSIEFAKIQDDYRKRNPVDMNDKTEAQQQKEEEIKHNATKAELSKAKIHDPMIEDIPEKPPKVNRFPNDEIEAMVQNSENAACNRRLLFSYLESMTDETYFSSPRPASSLTRKLCPDLERTCCLDQHFEELVGFYKSGMKKIENIETIMLTFLKTVELLSVDEVLAFSKSQELINQSKCVGLSDLAILVKSVESLKDNLQITKKYVTDYFQFFKEYFSGFVCHYCAVDAEHFFVFQNKGSLAERVEVMVRRTSCVQALRQEEAMIMFMKEFSKFLLLTRAIRCEQRKPEAEKMIIPSEETFYQQAKRYRSCVNTPAGHPNWKGESSCQRRCSRTHKLTYLMLKSSLTSSIIEAILDVKNKFQLKVMAPNDLLAYYQLENVITMYRLRKEADFNLDNNYQLKVVEGVAGLSLTDRSMNLTYINCAARVVVALLSGLLIYSI